MSKRLMAAIPELVNEKIISADTGQQIIEYYKRKNQSAPNHITLVLGIIGALLVGSGILLLIAHNWDDFSTLTKTVIAFIPLAAGQVLCGLAVTRYRSSKIWTEASGAFLFLAVGASISLISQVYQVSGSLSSFLLTWIALTVPLVYLLSSSLVAMLCLSAMSWYACELGYFERNEEVPYLYILGLMLLSPHYIRLTRQNYHGNFINVLNWLLAASLMVVLGAFSKNSHGVFIFLLYLLLFSFYYVKGRIDDFAGKRLLANPFIIIGITGIVLTFLYWSFGGLWRTLLDREDHFIMIDDPMPYILVIGTVGLIYMLWNAYRKEQGVWQEPPGYSVFVFALLISPLHNFPVADTLIVNAWILVIGLFYVRKGTSQNHFGYLNFGLTIIAALALCRFFDDDIPFFWRGLIFVAAGAGFFLANFLMIRRKKQMLKSPGHV